MRRHTVGGNAGHRSTVDLPLDRGHRGIIPVMVAYHSFGSRRAPVAMREVYPRPRPDDPVAAAAARTRSGWAIAEQLFPGRVYDHTCAIPLHEKSHPGAREVWLGEFGDTGDGSSP